MNQKQYMHARRYAIEVLAFLGKCALGLVILIPLIVMISWSLRPDAELVSGSLSLLPQTWTLEYYRWALENVPLTRYMLNSFICYFIIFGSHVILASCAAYAFTFFKFKGRSFFFTCILVAMVIPGDVTIIANYINIQKMGLVDTYLGLVFPFLISGMSIFMLRQFFLTVPREMKEAAEIDGCGDIRFLISILMPIAIPSLAALAIYDFISVYNQWFWPLLVTNSQNMRTVQVGLSQMITTEFQDEIGRMLAGSTFVILPTIAVFMIGQEYLIRGMVSGSVKG